MSNPYIYIKNDKGQKTVWLAEQYIVDDLNIKANNICVMRSRYKETVKPSIVDKVKTGQRQLLPDSGKAWRYGKINGQYFYCYDNIPDRAPKYLRSQLPEKQELLQLAEKQGAYDSQTIRENLINLLKETFDEEFDHKDIRFYMYEFGLSPEKSEFYAKRRAWLQVISNFDRDKIYRKKGIRTETEFFQIASSLTGEVKINTGGTLRKELHYYNNTEDKREYVISGKEGNQNARVVGVNKVVDKETGEVFDLDIHEALIYHSWLNPGHHGKLLKNDVYNTYSQDILQYGLFPLSKRTVCQYLNRYSKRSLASLERDGHSYFTDKYLPQVHRFKPKYVGTLWAADFSGSKLMYRYQKINKKTGKKQWSVGSWYLFRVVDAASGYIVGWSVAENGEKGENWETVRSGLNMALENNKGCLARELVTDNGPAFTGSNNVKLALLFDKHTRISKNHKRASIAETYVRLLNQQARYFDEFVGKTSFAATHIDNIANEDYVNINNLGTKEEVLGRVAELITRWNKSKRPDGTVPCEEFINKERTPGLKPVEAKSQRFTLGNKTTIAIGRQSGSVIVQKGSCQHLFTIPNWEVAMKEIDRALGGSHDLKVNIYWDENNADIYTLENRYILSAPKGTLSHPSIFEASEESRAAFTDGIKQQARLQRDARNFADNVVAARQALDFEPEDIDNIVEELTYAQRARLNGGKAKDEHNSLMDKVHNNIDDSDLEVDFDPQNEY